MATTVKYGHGGDGGLTAAGEYDFIVPPGCVELTVAQSLGTGASGGDVSSSVAGGDSGLKRGITWLLRAGGGARVITNGVGGLGGTPLVGTGFNGGAGANQGGDNGPGGGGGAGTTGAGTVGGNPTGGAGGTGSPAGGAGGDGSVNKGASGSYGTAPGGGGGGTNGYVYGGGGAGGFATLATIAVTAGETIKVVVGDVPGGNASGYGGAIGYVRFTWEAGAVEYTEGATVDSTVVLSGGANNEAGGPPPFLWAPLAGDSIVTDFSGSLSVATSLSGEDTLTLIYPETGELSVLTGLSQSDSSVVVLPLDLGALTTLGGTDGFGPGYAEVGELGDLIGLSGTDAIGLGYVEAGAFNVAAILSGSDTLSLPYNETGTLSGASVLSGAEVFHTPTVYSEVGTLTITSVLQNTDSLAIIVPPEGIPVFSYDSERRYVYAGHLIVSRQPTFSRSAR